MKSSASPITSIQPAPASGFGLMWDGELCLQEMLESHSGGYRHLLNKKPKNRDERSDIQDPT
ncbi:MAG: hypothetical protein JWM59_1786 [Verrucomicrobiales bacterium]|nr:hypothetical protein [Verrucomicrobiales bacterium]